MVEISNDEKARYRYVIWKGRDFRNMSKDIREIITWLDHESLLEVSITNIRKEDTSVEASVAE